MPHADIKSLTAQPPMSARLQKELALWFFMFMENLAGRRTMDREAHFALLDGPEFQDWMDKMDKSGNIVNTKYVNAATTRM